MNSSFEVFSLLREHFNPDAEEVWILVLDSQLNVLSKYMLFRGTVNHCLIHPRDVFRWVLMQNGSSFILAHNHPSHDPLPSQQDLIITQKIYRMAELFEVPLADHVIFTPDRYFSMADYGILKSRSRRMNQKLLQRLTNAIE